MSSFGPQAAVTYGGGIMVSADGAPEWKAVGVTIDWSTVTAVGADTTLPDGVFVKAGDKYLRYGTVLDLVGTAEVQTVTFTGGPTAGAATLTLPASGSDPAQTAVAVAFNATAAAVQSALNALPRLAGDVAVGRTGTGSAGDPYIYTLTFGARLGNVPQLTSANTFTGGTTPTVTHATSTSGAGTGLWGPADTTASDGRQALARGESFVLNETVLQSKPGSDHPAVIEGGKVWRARLLTNEAAPGQNAPTLANVLAAFPRLRLVD